MIDLKNRTRETRTYQYPRDVSAGPVRPQVLTVHRGHHNPKNGAVTVAEKTITVGGVLTLPPKSEVRGLPDALLNHPALKRDIAARAVSMKPYKPQPKRPASAAVEVPARARVAKKTAKKTAQKE